MLPILFGLGSIAALFCLLAFWRAEGATRGINQALCSTRHKVGLIALRHSAAIDCEKAIEVAEVAQMIWQRLELEFPGQSGKFTLFVIFDPSRGPGYWRGRKVVINLADHSNSGDLLDTLSEELHHLLYGLWAAQAGGEIKYVFKPKGFLVHEDVVRYYAVNPHEYHALRFAAALVGKRAQLLKEVEEYRKKVGIT